MTSNKRSFDSVLKNYSLALKKIIEIFKYRVITREPVLLQYQHSFLQDICIQYQMLRK